MPNLDSFMYSFFQVDLYSPAQMLMCLEAHTGMIMP
jgi:hypothetical protein